MSGSQKFINVMSILDIIFGILGLIVAILGLVGVGAITNTAVTEAGAVGAVVVSALNISLIIMAIGCLIEIVLGFLGTRAARDANKIGPVFVFAVIDVVLTVVQIIVSITQNSFQWLSLINLVLPCLMLYAANNVRKQKNAGLQNQ